MQMKDLWRRCNSASACLPEPRCAFPSIEPDLTKNGQVWNGMRKVEVYLGNIGRNTGEGLDSDADRT